MPFAASPNPTVTRITDQATLAVKMAGMASTMPTMPMHTKRIVFRVEEHPLKKEMNRHRRQLPVTQTSAQLLNTLSLPVQRVSIHGLTHTPNPSIRPHSHLKPLTGLPMKSGHSTKTGQTIIC